MVPLVPDYGHQAINVDYYDLERLIDLYKNRFSRVVVVPLPEIPSLAFIQDIYGLDNGTIRSLASAFDGARRENIGYSSLVMRLTFAKESAIRQIGLRSIASNDFNLRWLLSLCEGSAREPVNPRSRPPLLDKIKRLPAYVFSRLLSWRYLMQNVVNKYLPYRKYQLPEGIIAPELIAKNRVVYAKYLNRRKADEDEGGGSEKPGTRAAAELDT